MSSKAMCAKWINCGSIAPIFTFANLPGASDRLEGDEYDISDGRRASDNGAITTSDWGVTATGGGSSRVRVRFNGTNWTVCGM